MTIEQANERDQIIFCEDYNVKRYHGGVRNFSALRPEGLHQLVDKGYINPEERYNLSPYMKTYIKFVDDHPDCGWFIHGYTVSPDREDCRITITGLETNNGYDRGTLFDFVDSFRDADDFDVDNDSLYCWYD